MDGYVLGAQGCRLRHRERGAACCASGEGSSALGLGGAAEAGAADPFPLADYEALKAYRLANPRSPWLTGRPDDNQIALGKAEFVRRGGDKVGQKSEVLRDMAAELGQSRKTLDTALFGARKRVTKAAPKSPLPSVTDKAA